MKKLKQKLNSNRGASVMLALLFLIFATAIGAIILTAATVNMGRTNNVTAQEQSYQAVKSAASLIEKELETLSLTATNQTTTNYDSSGNPTGTTAVGNASTNINPNSPSYAKDLILEEFTKLYNYKNGISNVYTPTISKMEVSIPNIATFPSTEVSIAINENDYSIKIVLWNKNDETNIMTLNLIAKEQTTENTIFDYGSGENISGVPKSSTTTYLTTITYPNISIVKGGTTS